VHDERPVVVVVGAGLAGLTCAERLSGPVRVILVEARDRVGGRCWSASGWDDGQVAEHGGELVEAGQVHILRLVAELGLELESRRPQAPVDGTFRVAGETWLPDEIQGLPEVLAELGRQQQVAAVVPGRLGERRFAVELDEMSARDWIDQQVEGGGNSRLGRALDLLVLINLGVPTDRLSALSLHHMFIGLAEPGQAAGFAFGNDSATDQAQFGDVIRGGVTDTYHVSGGNDQLAAGLAARLPSGCLQPSTAVTGIRRRPDGRYVVRANGAVSDLLADRVVLATPLPPLRQVDLDQAGLSELRHQAIAQVPMATHRKLLLQLTRQPRTDSAWPGLLVTDAPPTAVWDSSIGQAGVAGLLTFFSPDPWLEVSGGHGPAPAAITASAAALVADLAPAFDAAAAPQSWLDDWPADPWAGGSYAAFAPGQYTRFADLLSTPENGIHFAGEHTSLASFGYMDGAISSGVRAAAEVLVSLFGSSPPPFPAPWRSIGPGTTLPQVEAIDDGPLSGTTPR
jgi:monoamine oxidase